MDKTIVLNYAKHEIDEDVKMFHKMEMSNQYIFYNSNRHCVGECFEEDILKWIAQNNKENHAG